MTREEMKLLAYGIRSVYGEKAIATQAAFDIWARIFEPFNYSVVNDAVVNYICTEHYPPKPADILDRIKSAKLPSVDYTEVMAEIRRAIRYSGVYEETEALNGLSENAKTVVERLGGWEATCRADFNNTTTRAQFRDIHNAAQEQKKNDITALMINGNTFDRIGIKK